MRRGSVSSLIIVIIILFFMAVVALFGYTIIDTLIPELQKQPDFDTTHIETARGTYAVVDNMFLFVFVGLTGFIIVMSFMIDTHPIYFVFSLIMFAIVILIALIFRDVYVEFQALGDLAVANAALPNMGLVLSNLPILITVMLGVVGLALYAKARRADASRGLGGY